MGAPSSPEAEGQSQPKRQRFSELHLPADAVTRSITIVGDVSEKTIHTMGSAVVMTSGVQNLEKALERGDVVEVTHDEEDTVPSGETWYMFKQ